MSDIARRKEDPSGVDLTPAGAAVLVDLPRLGEGSLSQPQVEAVAAEVVAQADARTEQLQKAGITMPAVSSQPTALLSSGFHIPLVGLGTWLADKGQVKEAVVTALRAGYRHIDCAAVYGNENEVGEGLAQAFSEGVVKREEVFVTSKLWNSEHAPERVEPALRKTLKDLQLDYVDLYLMHWPSSLAPGPTVTPPLEDTYKAMEACVDKGLARSIGVSNFSIKKLDNLLKHARIPPAVLQVEAHPYWRNDKLLSWCKEHNIHMTAYSPLGSPESGSVMGRAEDIPTPLKDATVAQVAEKLGKNPGQVLIRWAAQRGTSVIPKSVNPQRIASNFDVLSWSLPDEEFKKINSLPTQIRMVAGKFMVNPAGPYKSLEEVWDE